MFDDDELPQTQTETSRNGSGRSGKTRIGSGEGGYGSNNNFAWSFEDDCNSGDNPTAVICEYNSYLRRGMKAMLSNVVSVVGESAVGEDALKLVQTLRPSLLITDVDVNGIDGLALCGTVKAACPSVKVLITTDLFHATKYFHRLQRANVDGICLKKFGAGPLISMIDAIMTETAVCYSPELVTLIYQYVRSTPYQLSRIEVDVLTRLSQSDLELSAELDISKTEVVELIESLSRKLCAPTRTGLSLKAARLGFTLIPLMPTRDAEGLTSDDIEALKHAEAAIDRRERS